MERENNIVFYDGECGFCDTSIRQVMRMDRAKRIRYAPLQGSTASALLPAELRNANALRTIVYLDPNGLRHTKSEAAFEILLTVGGAWKMLLAFRVLPLGFRDSVYDAIAKRRRAFIDKASCPLPTPDQQARILD